MLCQYTLGIIEKMTRNHQKCVENLAYVIFFTILEIICVHLVKIIKKYSPLCRYQLRAQGSEKNNTKGKISFIKANLTNLLPGSMLTVISGI